jgi:hypothetical protein
LKVIAHIAMALVAASCAAAVFVGCASRAPSKPKQVTEALDWKGASLGQEIPKWVLAANEGSMYVQQLKEYKDQYAFIVNVNDANREFAIDWVKNTANGAAQISTMIATTVNTQAEAATAGQRNADVTRAMEEIRDNMSNASFNNVRMVGDFWILNRNRATGVQYYTAYSLWVAPQKGLNDQIAANIANIVENNKAMGVIERGIYADIIKDIRARGIAMAEVQ